MRLLIWISAHLESDCLERRPGRRRLKESFMSGTVCVALIQRRICLQMAFNIQFAFNAAVCEYKFIFDIV